MAGVADSQANRAGPARQGRSSRLTIRKVLVVPAVIAIGLAFLVGDSGAFFATIIYAAVFSIVFFGARGLAQYRPKVSRTALAVIAVSIALEAHAAQVSYYTIAEMASVALFCAILLNVVAVLVLAFGRGKTAEVLAVLLAALIVPEQILLQIGWNRRDSEARSVIAFVEATKKQTGTYPDDLSGYYFRHADLQGQIRSTKNPTKIKFVSYSVGSNSTTHDYSPAHGWFYYPAEGAGPGRFPASRPTVR